VYAVEMASADIMYATSCVTIGLGLQVILVLLSQQFETLQCWYY
jgi:hypothetical protein